MDVHDVVSHSDELGLLNRLGEDIRRHVQVELLMYLARQLCDRLAKERTLITGINIFVASRGRWH